MRHGPFGQYLVERGAITPEALLEALMHQLAATPSGAEIVFKEKLLPVAVQLQVIALQSRTGCAFADACRSLDAWTQHLEVEISVFVAKARPPIGHYLVEHGYISVEALTRELDAYVASSRDQHGLPAPPEPLLPRALVETYARIVGDEWRSKAIDLDERRRALAAARFLGARRSVQVLEAMVESGAHPDAVEVVWRLRQALVATGTEAAVPSSLIFDALAALRTRKAA